MASRLKLEAVERFGGKCQCPQCHVEHPDLLEFSHVNRDGGAAREIRSYHGLPTSRRALAGDRLLRHLKAHGWASETEASGRVQMLCKLCHTAYDRRIPNCGGFHETSDAL